MRTGRRGEKEQQRIACTPTRCFWQRCMCVANVSARARTFVYGYCWLPRTRSAEQILGARLPRCHCGKCWSLSTSGHRKSTTAGEGAKKERKRFFGRIISETLRRVDYHIGYDDSARRIMTRNEHSDPSNVML